MTANKSAQAGGARRMRSGVAEAADGARIGYSLHLPDAEPDARILLIHALAMDRSNWDGVIAALPSSFAAVAIDCRGHGQGRGETRLTLEGMADDIAAVLDQVGWPLAIVGGCSMGGCIAQSFAARHPGRTDALALVDTTAWYGEEGRANWQSRSERAAAEGLAALIPFQLDRWFSAGFQRNSPETVQLCVSTFLANDIASYQAACRMLGEADLRGVLPSIRCPASVMVGEEDYATPIAAARTLNEAIAGSELIVLAGARHFTPVERPVEVAQALASLAARARKIRQ